MKWPKDFHRIILSGPKGLGPKGAGPSKVIVRPILLKGARKIQVEEFVNDQAFHKNMDDLAAKKYMERMAKNFKNINIIKGEANLSHDKNKEYILKDGKVCEPLLKLGIMDEDGRVFKNKMNKFVQINNFLRILGDAVKTLVSRLPADKELEIVDFCCGKSYLTFVIQHFFAKILRRKFRITGIDSKSEVIEKCRSLGQDLECENINLIAGDIRDFNPGRQIDIALSLHACDTATDVMLKKAAELGAEVILAVPCCHKQLAKQVKNSELDFILKYGLLKERFAALLTDAARANWLENCGYAVDVMEFVDYDNSPKNVMLRAVKTNKNGKNDLNEIAEKFGIKPEIMK